MKLDIGCGEYRHWPDCTTVDLYHPNADVKATMWELPFPDNSVEEIWADSSLEHVTRWKIQDTLKEWLRVLQPLGVATISVPDMDYVCRYWLEHPERGAHAYIFGNQYDEGDFHRSGWNIAWFWADLEEAGFGIVKIERIFSHGQEMFRATVMKPPEGTTIVRTGFAFIAPTEEEKGAYDKLVSEKIGEARGETGS